MDLQQGSNLANEALIFRLPNELLLRICDDVCRPPPEDEPRIRPLIRGLKWPPHIRVKQLEDSFSLVLTCKRFHQFALPFLYMDPTRRDTLHIGLKIERGLLQETLMKKPELCLMVRRFAISCDSRRLPTEFRRELVELLGHLNSLRQLNLDIYFIPIKLWDAVCNVTSKDMPKLQELNLISEWERGPHLREILKGLELPSLRILCLDGRIVESAKSAGTSLTAREGTSSLTSLNLTTPPYRPRLPHEGPSTRRYRSRELREILAWPRALQHFRFLEPQETEMEPVALSIADFGTALRCQRTSLKSLHIGFLGSRSGCIDVADFTELESLQLFYRDVACTPEEAASMILAPKLHTLKLDFRLPTRSAEGFDAGGFDTFDEACAQWVVQVAQYARARNLALKEITLLFPSGVENYVWEPGLLHMPMIYERLDSIHKLEEQLERIDVAMFYTCPSREYFESMVKVLEDYVRAEFEADNADMYPPRTFG